MGNVVTTFTSDDRDVQKALERMHREMIKLREDNKRLAQESRNGASQALRSVQKWTMGLSATSAAYRTVQAAVRMVVDENHRLAESIDQVLNKLPESELKLQIQGKLSPEELTKQRESAQRVLTATPSLGVNEAFKAQTQLLSSGLKKQDVVNGQFLGLIADFKAATNQFGDGVTAQETVSMVQASASFLKAQGIQQPGAADVRGVAQAVTNLFETTELQAPQLSALATKASPLAAAGMTQAQQLSAFSLLKDQGFPDELAANSLKIVAGRLGGLTTAQGPELAALKKLGLNGSQVDMVGKNEGFTQALDTINIRLQQRVPEAERDDILEVLLGRQGVAAGMALGSNAAELRRRERIALMGTALESGSETFRESGVAARNRLDIRKDFALLQKAESQGGVGFADANDALDTLAAEGRGGNALDRGTTRALIGLSKSLGLRPTDATSATAGLQDRVQSFAESIPLVGGIARQLRPEAAAGVDAELNTIVEANRGQNAPADKLAAAADRLAVAAEKQAAQGNAAAAVNAFKTQAE